MLLFANGLLYAAWFWLPSDSRLGISPDDFVLSSETSQTWLFDAIRRDKRILFLGTSESNRSYNLGYQLNQLAPDDPQIIVVAAEGASPIHTSLLFARAKQADVEIPPLVLIVNLVFFTQSHDVISDSWLGKLLPSPNFYLLNHRDLRKHLGEGVKRAYDEHFALKRLLYPVIVQEYLGSLMYLRWRYPFDGSVFSDYLRVRKRVFNGALPRYDEERSVWMAYEAADEAMKSRWEVSRVEESLNFKGLESSVAILREQRGPVLLLVLPTNRTFYRHYGVDMAEYDLRYRAIRNAIASLASTKNTFLLDLYERPRLHHGFRDRMHNDEYGFFQLAQYIVDSDAYRRFIEAVREYYDQSARGEAGVLAPHP
jgi:hypothetical protein